MAFVSYAQNYEDVILWRALKSVGIGQYIDIGACHPTLESVSKGFYEQGWRGIHVEPEARYAELLRLDRPDEKVIEAVVSSKRGKQTFYEIGIRGWSTAAKDIADLHRQRGESVKEHVLRSLSLDQVLDEAAEGDIHWLKIDVEGLERDVLRSWRRSKRRPWIILIEAIDPVDQKEIHKDWEDLVLSKGYSFAYFDGLNRFYVSSEQQSLVPHFRYGPSLWDGFRLARTESELSILRNDVLSAQNREHELENRLSQCLDDVARIRALLDDLRAERDRLRRQRELLTKTARLVAQSKRNLRLELALERKSKLLLQEQLDQATDKEAELQASFSKYRNEHVLDLARRHPFQTFSLKPGDVFISIPEDPEKVSNFSSVSLMDKLSRNVRMKRRRKIVRASGLFDPAWYLGNNPDVAASGSDPLIHFVTHGSLELRSPGPHFDSFAYCRNNPDVQEARLEPLFHYIFYGHREGRLRCP
jgi:FkbM family methyltransferase